MYRPTLLEGILVALVLSLSVSPLVVLVQLAVGSLLAWKIGVMAVSVHLHMLPADAQREEERSGDIGCAGFDGVAGWSRLQRTVYHHTTAVRDAHLGYTVLRLQPQPGAHSAPGRRVWPRLRGCPPDIRAQR